MVAPKFQIPVGNTRNARSEKFILGIWNLKKENLQNKIKNIICGMRNFDERNSR